MSEKIDPKKAKELIEKNKDNPKFRVIDVRTKEEFSEEHVKGALNLDIYDERFDEVISKLDKDKTYLVYCKSGGRCGSAAELMDEMGFKKVYSVIGWLFG